MKPGDLVICLPEYTESKERVVGMILRENDLLWHASTVRYDVLFPEGVFPMYDYEMEALEPELVQNHSGYVKIDSIEEAIDEAR